MLEEINKSIERAKKRRSEALARFHIGDVCMPLYQTWFPTIWGTIVDIGVVKHKFSVNLNGIVRQFDPEELVLTNPELRSSNYFTNRQDQDVGEIKQVVENAFQASKSSRIARMITAKELHPKLFTIKSPMTAYKWLMNTIAPVLKGIKRDTSWENIRRVEEAIQDTGVELEHGKVDSSNYHIDGGSKTYEYTVSYKNIDGKTIILDLQLMACSAGTVDDPWSAYDLILMLRQGKMKNASITAAYDNQRHLDVQDDIWAIELAQSSISLLYHYLKVHAEGTNKRPWRDQELTNSRNEIRDCINKAKDREAKKLLDEILKFYAKIKNEKQSLQDGMKRLKEIAPKTEKLLKQYRDEEDALQKEWQKEKNASVKTAGFSQLTKAIYDPIEFALVDYLSNGYTSGQARDLIKKFEDCVEKSKKLFEKKEYEAAKKELSFIGQNLRQLSPLGGSWKKWGLPLNDQRGVYHEYQVRLSKAFVDLRNEISEYCEQFYDED